MLTLSNMRTLTLKFFFEGPVVVGHCRWSFQTVNVLDQICNVGLVGHPSRDPTREAARLMTDAFDTCRLVTNDQVLIGQLAGVLKRERKFTSPFSQPAGMMKYSVHMPLAELVFWSHCRNEDIEQTLGQML